MTPLHAHSTHPRVRNRLQRADGHLHNVVAMIDEGRPCLQIVQQLHAVERAISAAKKALIHDHLDHCLEDAVRAQPRGRRAAVAEFKDITKYL
ncbi:MAG: metal-sensing transcriptional repressor [Ramlibacter sp.]